jgi:peroxiredoxin
MPLLQAAYGRHQAEGLTVIGVNFEEGEHLVAPYVAELGLTFDVLYDPEAVVGKAYQVNGLPTTFFIDRQGIIRDIQVGQVDERKLTDTLASLIE